jgi:hypothetical protein
LSISVAQLKSYIAADLNIIVAGEAGTGKTEMLKQACAELKLKVKYFSAPTMDPIIELLGIPVPDVSTKSMEYYRSQEIEECEVIFMDELNRAPVSVLNAVFEIIQTKSVNGTPLPKLKCVVAAINPVSDKYDTDELDLALLDRFDIYLQADVEASPAYFRKKYGDKYAKAGISFFTEYQKGYNSALRSKSNKMGYMSPRRLDKLMEIFQKFPTPQTVAAVLPADVTVSTRMVANEFNIALGNTSGSATPSNRGAKPSSGAGGDPVKQALVERQLSMKTNSDLRSKSNAGKFIEAYNWAKDNDASSAQKLRVKASEALRTGIGPATFTKLWKDVAKDFKPNEESKMMGSWPANKIWAYRAAKKHW